jgi:hypothetical protein
MNCNPTLTAEEFKTIHNALWSLGSIQQQLEAVLNKDLYNELATATNQIRQGLVSAYEQDDKAFESKNDHYTQVRQELGLTAVWSMYEVSNLSDRHPFEGVTKVVYRSYESGDHEVAINGSTWAALYVAANAIIRDSGDNNHTNPEILFMSTGS